MEAVSFKLLMRTVAKNDLIKFKAIVSALKETGDLNEDRLWKTKGGDDSVFHAAVRQGSFDILRYAIEQELIGVNFTNHDRKTLLHEAAQFSQKLCASYLIAKGADTNAIKKADWTPLMLACTKKDVDIVSELLENGADPLMKNKDGWNSFNLACRVGLLPIVDAIHRAAVVKGLEGPLVTQRSINGRSSLHTAALHGHHHVIRKILETKLIDVNTEDNCGTTPIMDACCSGNLDLVKMMVQEFGADVRKVNKNFYSAERLAKELDAVGIAGYLESKEGRVT